MQKIIISILIFILGAVAGIAGATSYIINNINFTVIEKTESGFVVHYELYEQEFEYFADYTELKKI